MVKKFLPLLFSLVLIIWINECKAQLSIFSKWKYVYRDLDRDGYGRTGARYRILASHTASSAFSEKAGDCNDNLPGVYPGAPEKCNGIDDNCNGLIDDSATVAVYLFYDADGDGYGDSTIRATGCDSTGFVKDSTDCNDEDADIHPGAAELCNHTDDDCDGGIDESADQTTFYADADGDTYGNYLQPTLACDQPSGYVTDTTDCNDADADIHPGVTDACNGIDDDCDGDTDEDATPTTWYADVDGDGYGAAASSLQACEQPAGYVANNTDCDDTRAYVHPGATEICNGLDDDCNSSIDDNTMAITWYADADGDGYGNAGVTTSACAQPAGYVLDNTDCFDGSSSIHPGATETCNNTDDDCDTQIDEGTHKYYVDANHDGYADDLNDTIMSVCVPAPDGYTSNGLPPDDTWTATNTGDTVNMMLHTACAADINYTGQNPSFKERDVFAQPYFGLVQALNFRYLHWLEGAGDDHFHVKVNDTLVHGTGKGYNGDSTEWIGTGQSGSYSTAMQGVLGYHGWTKDFHNEMHNFIRALGIREDIIANVFYPKTGELQWLINRDNPNILFFGCETNNSGNQFLYPTGATYRDKWNDTIDKVELEHPEIITVFDAAPIDFVSSTAVAWNNDVDDMHGDAFRSYYHVGKLVAFTGDPVRDLELLDSGLTYTMPTRLLAGWNKFGHRPTCINQWYEPHFDGFPIPYQGAFWPCLYIAKWYRFLLLNDLDNDYVLNASFMSLNYLINKSNVVKAEYYAMVLAGKLFQPGATTVTVDIGIEGVTAIGMKTGSMYAIMYINQTGSTIDNPGLTADGVAKTPITITCEHAPSLGSLAAVYETRTNPDLLPYSITVITY